MTLLKQEPIDQLKKDFSSSFKFRLALMGMLPMGFLSGMKIVTLTEERCVVSVPYKRLNKNPFKSTFWAVLGMAAEMASGALLVMFTRKQKPSVAMLVVKCEGQFHKKATSLTYFTCEDGQKIRNSIEETMQTKVPVLIETTIEGRDAAGELIATFTFVWSVKGRA